ncbi:oligosaccharide MFS transporter [Rouxiella sp. Mn2063]|uniref:oligosaccharide MFS transporter n=1 Tax=Rouxiella sp. Mn2063 TaxID=3395262 RepID=UPI003BC8105D
MKTLRENPYLILSGLLFAFFFTWSSTFSLVAMWLNQKVGLKGEDTAMMLAVCVLAALCSQPLFGIIQDKLGLKKSLLWFISLLLLCSGPLFIFFAVPLLRFNIFIGSVVLGTFVGVTFNSGVGVVESYIERMSRRLSFEYGSVRMWGSLGWAMASLSAGLFFNINPDINFWIASFSAVVFFLLLCLLRDWSLNTLKTETATQSVFDCAEKLTLGDALSLLLLPRFWALVIFVIGVSIYNTYDQQFPTYFASKFSEANLGHQVYNLLNPLQFFIEAVGMFMAPFLINRIGAKQGLILSGLLMSLRIFTSGVTDDTLYISLLKLLHAIESPILLISLFKYITTRFDPRLSTTLYLVGFQFATSLSVSLLSSTIGHGYELFGFSDTYMVMAALVFAFTFVSGFLLESESLYEESSFSQALPSEK